MMKFKDVTVASIFPSLVLSFRSMLIENTYTPEIKAESAGFTSYIIKTRRSTSVFFFFFSFYHIN